MSDASPPVEPESAPATCPECGRSAADYLTMGEVYDLHGYAKSKCLRCLASDVPRPRDVPTRPWTPTGLFFTTDPDAWADEFCRLIGEKIPAIRNEWQCVRAWFASAFRAGDIASDVPRPKTEKPSPQDAG